MTRAHPEEPSCGATGRATTGAILPIVTHATISELDPLCPGAPAVPIMPGARTPVFIDSTGRGPLRAVHRPFDTIPPATWDALVGVTSWATPFSRWGVQRAWWDAYAANAHDQTLAIVDEAAPDDAMPVAIVPLMHRHEVEPDDAILRTRMRGAGHAAPLTPVAPDRKAVFFGASYHADYATALARPADLSAVARAVADALATGVTPGDAHPDPWDVIDLRRLRCGDPAADELEVAFGAHLASDGWTVVREREEVCPVLVLAPGLDFEGYLGTLGKKERHEVRRKIRRAEAAGEVRLDRSSDPVGDLDEFVNLHQKKWGADGLFPPTPGGAQSRAFFRGLFEHCGPDGLIALHFLTVGGRRIAAGVWFDDGETLFFYNAGVDPDARDLSPGVLLVARSIEMALQAGRSRFDFLRGDEPYKYGWGATDVPIQRLLVVRTTS
jgi:CelD/BcsL family acetyltransferase involved in cellulose biosynthesis